MKRRRVFGAAAAYVVLAALLIELSGAIFEALLLPDWAARLFTVILILGFPVVVVLAWFFDISVEGLSRTEAPAPGSEGGRRDPLADALARAGSVPVPAEPLRGARRRKGGPQPDPDEAVGDEPDAERVRAATLSHVRHELRTPINGIIGYSEMLLDDVEDNAIRSDLERIRTAGRQLLERVDAVLGPDALSGTDPGELEAFAAGVRKDLRTPISSVVGYAELLMEACEEEGRDQLLPDLERILISARRLLDRSEDIVGIATLGSGNAVTEALAASSTITRDVLARIRTGEATTQDGHGRLLVIDDNETNRDLLSRQLARFGYVVATATNGREGLKRLETEDFDLVLMDVIMPEMDGVEALQRLQADDRLAAIPVIMLSSLDEVESAVRCIELGALDYVAKPVQPVLLQARIAAALDIRELHRREEAYRKRVSADGALIDRLLAGVVPGPLRDRFADGAVDLVESFAAVTAIRAVVSPDLRPSAEDVDQVRSLSELLARFEALISDGDLCVWRPDGCLLLIADGDGESSSVRAAALLREARGALNGQVGFGVHTGAAVGGMIGRAQPRFEVWGEAVETAEAVARLAVPGEVLVTPDTESALRDSQALEARGIREVAGTQMRVHALVAGV